MPVPRENRGEFEALKTSNPEPYCLCTAREYCAGIQPNVVPALATSDNLTEQRGAHG